MENNERGIVGIRKRIVSDQEVNCGRQVELDIAKAVLIFCLALVHCTIECIPESKINIGLPFVFDSVIGGPLGAPMFMYAMGTGMVYTTKNNAFAYARRGIDILKVGFLLNICRFLIPYLIGFFLTHNYEKYIRPLPYRLFGNDMLQFAGLCMLMMAWMLFMKMPIWLMILISFLLSLAGNALNGIDAGNPVWNIILGYFIGTEDAAGMVISDFPLCNWMIVPVCGYFFGKRLLHVKNKGHYYAYLSPSCLVITCIYFYYGIKNRLGMFGPGENCYYHISTLDVIFALFAAFGLLGIYYFFAQFLGSSVLRWIKAVSVNITLIYCIHWVFVVVVIDVFIFAVRGTQELSFFWTMVIGTAISIVSILIAHWYMMHKKRQV